LFINQSLCFGFPFSNHDPSWQLIEVKLPGASRWEPQSWPLGFGTIFLSKGIPQHLNLQVNHCHVPGSFFFFAFVEDFDLKVYEEYLKFMTNISRGKTGHEEYLEGVTVSFFP